MDAVESIIICVTIIYLILRSKKSKGGGASDSLSFNIYLQLTLMQLQALFYLLIDIYMVAEGLNR